MSDADLVQHLGEKMTEDTSQQARLDAYYDGALRLEAMGLALPPEMRKLTTVVNWPRLVVDSLEERLDVEGFRLGGAVTADEELWGWWQANNLDEESGLAHLEALVQGRAYIAVGAPENAGAAPVITVESARSMYAQIDPRTRRVTRALRLYDTRDGQAHAATLYLPQRTGHFRLDCGRWRSNPDLPTDEHNLGVVPVVPITNRSRLSDRRGRSEMADVIPITDAACRSLTNLQGAQELLAVPQNIFFGVEKDDFVDQNGKALTTWEAYLGRMKALANQDAKAVQLPGADLRNFTEVINHYARIVGALSGLPPHFLGFTSDNPASADAIRSSEARLVKRAERRARMFGEAWEQAMRLAMRIVGRDEQGANRLETVWRDPSTPTYAARADAVTKLFQAGLLPQEAAWEQLGFSPEYRRHLRSLGAVDPAVRYLELIQEAGQRPTEVAP
ncbi:phage portal protein [Nocardiopsis gilva YIM 90087]|uniref:Phage portal protein n=1 Tax=Nocardiopsis gilva YIM 90087 TaxID=1235441 RepID=A0A223RZX8_9ACTN|nr:phage portal protein [Nocardiopsis gilva]ASU81414.1 phage portal protein [Nocardiopsis gilva YIM 90087]